MLYENWLYFFFGGGGVAKIYPPQNPRKYDVMIMIAMAYNTQCYGLSN